MRRELELGDLLQLAVALLVFVGFPLLQRLLKRQAAPPAKRGRPSPPVRDPSLEDSSREEELRRGKDLFESLRRGAAPAAAPAKAAHRGGPPGTRAAPVPARPADPAPSLLPSSAGDHAGSLAGMAPAETGDEERLARQAADRALAEARERELAGAALQPALAREPADDPRRGAPGARRGRFELRRAVLAAELLGPPLGLRADSLGPTSPAGLRPF